MKKAKNVKCMKSMILIPTCYGFPEKPVIIKEKESPGKKGKGE